MGDGIDPNVVRAIEEEVRLASDPTTPNGVLRTLSNLVPVQKAKLANPNIAMGDVEVLYPWHFAYIADVFANPVWELWSLEDPNRTIALFKAMYRHAETWRVAPGLSKERQAWLRAPIAVYAPKEK